MFGMDGRSLCHCMFFALRALQNPVDTRLCKRDDEMRLAGLVKKQRFEAIIRKYSFFDAHSERMCLHA